MAFSSVVFPAPLGPMTATMWSALTDAVTSVSARRPPKATLRARTSMALGRSAACGVPSMGHLSSSFTSVPLAASGGLLPLRRSSADADRAALRELARGRVIATEPDGAHGHVVGRAERHRPVGHVIGDGEVGDALQRRVDLTARATGTALLERVGEHVHGHPAGH